MRAIFSHTPEGIIKSTIEYNPLWNKYQVYIDGILYEGFRTPSEAAGYLSNAFSPEDIIQPDYMFTYNSTNPLFLELSRLLRKPVSDCDFERLYDNTFQLLKHTQSGKIFHCIHKPIAITLEKYCELQRKNIFTNDPVHLKEGEYKKGKVLKRGGSIFTTIEIPAFAELSHVESIYAWFPKIRHLYFYTETGRPQKQTLFFLPESDTDIPEDVKIQDKFRSVITGFFFNWKKENYFLSIGSEEYIRKFENDCRDFLQSSKEKYRLTEEDIEEWLNSLIQK